MDLFLVFFDRVVMDCMDIVFGQECVQIFSIILNVYNSYGFTLIGLCYHCIFHNNFSVEVRERTCFGEF